MQIEDCKFKRVLSSACFAKKTGDNLMVFGDITDLLLDNRVAFDLRKE